MACDEGRKTAEVQPFFTRTTEKIRSFQHTEKCCNSSRPTTTPSSSSSWHSHSLSTFFQSLQRYTRAIREWGGENIQYNASLDVQESRKSAIFIKRLIYNNNKNREKFHEANNASDQFNKEKHESNPLTMIAQCLYSSHTHTHASFYFHCSAVQCIAKGKIPCEIKCVMTNKR